ncbi:MAG: molybdopterin/thiamine biosynthesis adenylyltransferase [Bacteriovoracaceae bacterium]|jgi:molybdopterin/thiamine biosynthesis adenylyltransferase
MFDYKEAFVRNLGWVTTKEQEKIKNVNIAIIGLGGVGGHHAHCLTRIGFSNFKISDLDIFEVQNFNRQFGAMNSTIGKKKTDVIKSQILDINPDANIVSFEDGINLDNMESFLEGVDIICDGLDLYCSELRTPLYDLAHKKGIHVVSAGPFGFGTSVIAFDPKGMSFGKYFDLNDGNKNLTVEAMIIRFLVGMAPSFLHSRYIAAPDKVDLFGGTLPSIHAGCYAASAALATTVVKIALKRGDVFYAPRSYQVDFYLNKMKKTWLPFGNRNPFQRFKIKAAHRMFKVKEFS